MGISLINISANFWSGDDLEIEEGEVVRAGCRIEREGREEKREVREGGGGGRGNKIEELASQEGRREKKELNGTDEQGASEWSFEEQSVAIEK